MKGYVYLIQCTPPKNSKVWGQNYFKIGKAKNVSQRVDNLQVGCPFPLTVIAYALVEDCDRFEKDLHFKYASDRKLGEWFGFMPGVAAQVVSDIEWADRMAADKVKELDRLKAARVTFGTEKLPPAPMP